MRGVGESTDGPVGGTGLLTWGRWRGEGDEQVLLGAELWTVFQIEEGGKCRGPGGISGGLIQGMAGEERKLRLEKVTETFQGRH